MTGTKRPNSTVGRIRAYFEANPDEELTYEDLRAKFDLNPAAARQAVKQMRERKELETQFVIRLTPSKKSTVQA